MGGSSLTAEAAGLDLISEHRAHVYSVPVGGTTFFL